MHNKLNDATNKNYFELYILLGQKIVLLSSYHFVMQKETMIGVLLFVFGVVTTCIAEDTQLHAIKTDDLKNIVDSVQKDVDRHLKLAYANRRMESISHPDSPEFSAVVEDTENGNEYRNFMKMIQNSMHHHLVKNLGQPSDAEKGGSEQLSKIDDKDRSEESSSQMYEIRIGSTKGVPGINFPDYTDIPITSFSCEDKPHIPGFYADLDTGCQVFHVCWPDRRESFLCPLGTTYNQALKVCDYWYNFNCSLAPYYYIANEELKPDTSKPENESLSSMINILLEETDSVATQKPETSTFGPATSDSVLPFISQFIPIKAKIVVYPKTATQRLKVFATASIGKGKKSNFEQKTRRKSSYTSKHFRVPRSLEYTESSKDAIINSPEDLPLGRKLFHIYEEFDRAIIDIESNETLSKLSEYAKRAAKSIKSFLTSYVGEPLKHFNPEPESEMYKQDMAMQEKMKGGAWKQILLLVAHLMEQYHEKEAKFLREREALQTEPLTNLNPRFVIKPAEQTSGQQNPELQTLDRIKRSATVSNPTKLWNKDRLNIHPETKKLLIKNYTKLFKTKHKHI